MKQKYFFLSISIVIVLLFVLASCAGPNPMIDTAPAEGEAAGFLKGLLHGFISLFTFIVSLFSDTVGMYEVHNTGGWYDFGFVLGAMIFYSSGGRASSTRKK
jgi:hypothetical protein